ncbi:MAG: DNA polymerase III subunit delta [Cyanobacteria bacterium LVE1205-1]|jgi:DNA polymerase-3 subunit delta
MAVYIYWGDDEFAIEQAVVALRDRTLDPAWFSFNFQKISPDHPNSLIEGLNLAMTPPFGIGQRFIWLRNSPLAQRCPEDWLIELQRTIPSIPSTSVLLITSLTKLDGRLKSTKLLLQYAHIQEFSSISPWKTEELVQRVRAVAEGMEVKLTPKGAELLAQATGTDTRQLYNELQKLKLYVADSHRTIPIEAISNLVRTTTQNSLQLLAAIREGNLSHALEVVAELLNRNEPCLRIAATLTGQFRTWLWVKLLLDMGEQDKRVIVQSAEISNPKRLYFIQQEVKTLSLNQLQQSLPILLELESMLKKGDDEAIAMETTVIQLCQLFKSGHNQNRG